MTTLRHHNPADLRAVADFLDQPGHLYGTVAAADHVIADLRRTADHLDLDARIETIVKRAASVYADAYIAAGASTPAGSPPDRSGNHRAGLTAVVAAIIADPSVRDLEEESSDD